MNIKDVSISKGMTVNLGNYNSHRVEFGLTASFDKGEDFEAEIEKLTQLVNQKLANEIKGITDQSTEKGPKRQTLMEQEDDEEGA